MYRSTFLTVRANNRDFTVSLRKTNNMCAFVTGEAAVFTGV